MSQATLLKKLLLNKTAGSRLWFSLIALCAGTTLLLLSVLAWWNFKELLEGRHDNDSLGSTFLTIGKKVTDETMGRPDATLFSPAEIAAIRIAPQVQDVGTLTSNRFPVYAIFSQRVGFATEMFLEAADDAFIDKKPADWQWQPGHPEVPVIISSDFLNLYNYGFALSQGLPQLSESSIKSISFELRIGRDEHAQIYRAHVAGFSDRISSVLVPHSFITHGNRVFAGGITSAPSRLILKAKDPSDQQFINYLQTHNYTTNSEQLRWNKLRGIVDVVTSATGILALLLMGISTLVFILFIELTIAKAAGSLKTLLEQGYSPAYLGRFMTRQFIPFISAVMLLSLLIVCLLQYIISIQATHMQLHLPLFPGWPVQLVFAISIIILLFMVQTAIKKAIKL